MTAAEFRSQLAHFTGSETFTRHSLSRSLLMTEGVVFLASAAGAYWLTDAIASYQHTDRVLSEHFQVWHLTVDAKTRSATLTMKDGNSDAAMITQAVEYTDFPLDDITLWLVRDDQHWVLMLPSEY